MHYVAITVRGDIAQSCARIDPARAERMINEQERDVYTAPDETIRAIGLISFIKAFPGVDPGRARQLISDAAQAARSIPDETIRARELARLIKASAGIHPA